MQEILTLNLYSVCSEWMPSMHAVMEIALSQHSLRKVSIVVAPKTNQQPLKPADGALLQNEQG